KIKASRIFYVNYCTLIELNSNQTHRSANYERIIHNCSQAYYLYEYHLGENIFRDYYTDIMTDLSNLNIEGVHEMNVPLDFHLLYLVEYVHYIKNITIQIYVQIYINLVN
ncbi:unnamed protein product, partial [Rotaria magnacalcarata]